jgi:hypothetical protein
VAPVAPLRRAVACVWAQQVAAAGPAYEHRTVPNGCVEITHALGSDVAVAGEERRPIVGLLAPGTRVVRVRLRPGAARTILGWPAAELALSQQHCADADSLARLAGEAGYADQPT